MTHRYRFSALLPLALLAFFFTGCAPADPDQSSPSDAISNAASDDDSPVATTDNALQDAADTLASTVSDVAAPSAELIATGDTVFNDFPGFCAKCHLAGGVGSDRAPNLTDDTWTQSDGTIAGIAGTITSGVSKDEFSSPDYPFAMNSAAKMNLEDDLVQAVAAYVWSLSR